MTILAAIGIALVGFLILAYTGAPLVVSTIAVAAFIGGLFGTGIIGTTGLIIAAAIFVPAAVLLNVTSLRRSILTAPIFSGFKKVLPPMTSTEREALEAGDTWWETEMFRGKPEWNKLLDFECTKLTADEQSFMDNQVETLCAMIDDWKIQHEDKDLSPETWDYMRKNGFFAMLITKEWGGLGFSAYAQSCVVTKIATRSIAAGVTVMVPNSLGPGELLMHYGTDEQKKFWLPGLADGTHVPCFGLTGPEAGSDAGAIPDVGIVCKGEFEGQEVLGMKLTFAKRYITLAPASTVVGLAFKLHDPEGLLGDPNKSDYGITCALIPSDFPGVDIGRRHYPAGSAFMNGPINGDEIFVPIDWIIGGKEKAGKGWRMLVECLSAGRGISLPALSAAAGKMSYRMTGPYMRIRRQFKTPIGKFEGIQEASGRIAGLAYTLEACRVLTASAVDNCAPSVVTAMMKYHMTEMMRTVLTDAMDIHGGRGVMAGPRNYLTNAYQGVPIAITVEGANILTRNLMIFGQGAIRCHPYVFPEMEAARDDNLEEFDKLLWGHIGYSINRGVRAFIMGLTGAKLVSSPVNGEVANYYRQLERMSASLAFVSDVTMGILGGELKRKERLSARLGDVLSHLYMATAVLKYYKDNGETQEDLAHVHWSVQNSLAEIQKAFDEFLTNFPNRFVAGFMRRLVFPLGRSYTVPNDDTTGKIAEMMLQDTALRNRITDGTYIGDENDQTGRMEHTFKKLLQVEKVYNKFYAAAAKGKVDGFTAEEQIASAIEKGVLSAEEGQQVAEYNAMRYDAIITDAFTKEYLSGQAENNEVALTKAA